jgi:hypothetical protein
LAGIRAVFLDGFERVLDQAVESLNCSGVERFDK